MRYLKSESAVESWLGTQSGELLFVFDCEFLEIFCILLGDLIEEFGCFLLFLFKERDFGGDCLFCLLLECDQSRICLAILAQNLLLPLGRV